MEIKLITYNIHRAIGLDRRFRPERIKDILASYNADIVLLQEVDEGVPRSRELNLAKELAEGLNYSYYALGHNVSLKKGYYGNATLSRFPILRERNINLTVDNKKRRGCQHTSIELSNSKGRGQIEVFNLHLGLSAKEREKQSSILFRSAELKHLNPQDSCVIAGDFNDWRSSLRAFYSETMGFECATDRKTNKGVRAIKSFPSFSPKGALDRIYYRGGLEFKTAQRCRKRIAKVASDHLPIIATFDVSLNSLNG